MSSYLDYPVCNRGTNVFSAKAGYHNLNHGYMPSNSCATGDGYAPDGRLVAPASAPHQNPGLPLHHQAHLDLQFAAPANTVYSSHLEYGHHQYGLAPEQERGYAHAQVSPLGTSVAPYTGDSCGPAVASGSQYLHFGNAEQRLQEYPDNVYARLPPQSKKELEHVEETCRTFDWMKVKRNPPKTGSFRRPRTRPEWGIPLLGCVLPLFLHLSPQAARLSSGSPASTTRSGPTSPPSS